MRCQPIASMLDLSLCAKLAISPPPLSLARSLADVTRTAKPAVAQTYLPPLLHGGKKFDLRLYCLIASVCPMEAYLHTEVPSPRPCLPILHCIACSDRHGIFCTPS